MSTIVAVRKNGYAIIGADTLAKLGSTKQNSELIKNHGKIIKVGENYIAHVGDVVFGHILQDFFSKFKEIPKLSNPQEIFLIACQLHNALKEDYFIRPEEDEDDDFESSRFKCLIVNSQGIFGLYELRSVDEFSKYYSFGTGNRFALGAMNALYNTNASVEEIAQAGLEAAAEFDDSTQGPFEFYKLELSDKAM